MTEDSEQLGQIRQRGPIGLKVRSVFLPYWAIATAIPILYSLLHWLLIVSSDVPLLDEDLTNFILPICLPWVVIMLWFRHRIKLLKWPKANDAFLGYFAAWICLSVPTIIAQDYLESASGGLTRLERVSQVVTKPYTKYYTIHQFVPDKSQSRRLIRTSTSGRLSQSWNISVNYAIPLLDPGQRFDANVATAWLGVTYDIQLSNNLSQEEKRKRLTDFVRQSEQKLNNDDFHWVSYFTTIGRNKVRASLEEAIKNGADYKVKAPAALLSAHAGTFEARTGKALFWSFGTYSAGVGLWLLFALTMKIHAPSRRQWTNGKPPSNGDLRGALALLLPREKFFITPILVDLNLLVWLAMVCCGLGIDSISPNDVLNWGGVYSTNVHDGEIWRLLTSLFVHAGLLHLANNMVSLVLLGLLLEGAFGSWWFTAVYFISGMAGSLGSMIWNPNLVSVGASGCIFGIAGFGLALLLLKRRRFASERPVLLKVAAAFLGINWLLGAIIPGIDLAAHLVGLASGGLLGVIASPQISNAPTKP